MVKGSIRKKSPSDDYATNHIGNRWLREMVNTVCDAQEMLSGSRPFTFEDASSLMVKLLNYSPSSGLADLYWRKLDQLWGSHLERVESTPQQLLYQAQHIVRGGCYFEPDQVAGLLRGLGEYESVPGVPEHRRQLDDLWYLVQSAQGHAEGLLDFNRPLVKWLLDDLQPYATRSAEISGLHNVLRREYAERVQHQAQHN